MNDSYSPSFSKAKAKQVRGDTPVQQFVKISAEMAHEL